jgi:ABC-type branched-subunit amino acid transport system substrate-binding protein
MQLSLNMLYLYSTQADFIYLSNKNGWDWLRRVYSAQSTLKIYILLGTILFLSACAGVELDTVSPTMKIGLVAPFEGLHRPLGYEALFAVKLALQERNLKGGINGYQVELVALNDFDDPAEAKTQAKVLTADPDVLGVVGHLSSATTLAALPIYQEASLALSVPWTIEAADPQSVTKGVVRVAANEAETSLWLDTIRRDRGFNNVVNVTDLDFDSMPASVQALELATEGVTAGEIILALKRAEVSLPLFGQVDVGSPQTVQVAEAAANGLIFVSPGPDAGDLAGTDDFIEAYQALAGFPPGPRAVLAYDATNILLDAIEQGMLKRNRQPIRSNVSAIINNIQRRGISGDIAFDAQGQRVNAPVWVYRIADEEYPGVLIAP